MIDMVIGTVIFVCSVRMAESGATPVAVTAVLTLNSLVYMSSTQLVGRLVSPRNAAGMLIATSLFMTLISAAFIAIPGLKTMYVLIIFQAIALAFFFTPFQVFMKAVDGHREGGIVKSTSLYTFSWSMGMAMGPFISGYLWVAAGWQWCYVVNGLLALMTAIGVFCLKHHAQTDETNNRENVEPSERARAYSRMPNLAWLGWICSGAGCVAWSLIRGFFPVTGAYLEIPKPDQGVVMALVLGAQAFSGLFLYKSRIWMYQVWPAALFGITGMTGLLLFALARTTATFYIASILFGAYAGAFFFYLVFHSISHPSRSARYIATNETVVGLAGIIGPFSAGFIAQRTTYSMPYIIAMLLIALALILQVVVHIRHKESMKTLQSVLRKSSAG